MSPSPDIKKISLFSIEYNIDFVIEGRDMFIVIHDNKPKSGRKVRDVLDFPVVDMWYMLRENIAFGDLKLDGVMDERYKAEAIAARKARDTWEVKKDGP